MQMDDLTGRLKDITTEFDELTARRESDLKRMYQLQGAHALLDDLIKNLEGQPEEEQNSERKPRRAKIIT